MPNPVTGLPVFAMYSTSGRLVQSAEAILNAGMPSSVRKLTLVMSQALWLGGGGALMAVPLCVALARVALRFHTQVVLSAPILGFTFALTLGMAFVAGLFSLRPLRNLEAAKLLR